MKTHEEVRAEVTQLISTELGIPQDSIEGKGHLSDLTTDSIQLFELLLAFERFYQIETTYEDIVHLNSVDDVIQYVMQVKYGQPAVVAS